MDSIAKYILSNHIGLTEKVNGQNSPTVLGWIQKYFKKITNTGEIPWCSIGMREACISLGIPCDKQTPAAISWATWGKEIHTSQISIEKNQVVVLKRKGGNHVTSPIRYSVAKQIIYCVGYNQGDAVTVEGFPFKDVLTIREL